MHKSFDRIDINSNWIFEKELTNNFLPLKKGYLLGKSKKRSYLIDTFYDYIYVYNRKKNFKHLYSTPIQLKNLKSKNFAKLKVSSNLIKYQSTLKQIPKINEFLKNEKKDVLLTSISSQLSAKYKNLLTKVANSSSINSFLTTNSKKDIFLTSQNPFFVKRGSINHSQNNCFLDINFKNIKNNFIISKKRKKTTFGLNSYFYLKNTKNENYRKNSKKDNN